MDSRIAAARAPSAGDTLGALKPVALRDDAPARALRGIAMARPGDLVRERTAAPRGTDFWRAPGTGTRALLLAVAWLHWAGRCIGPARAGSVALGLAAVAVHMGAMLVVMACMSVGMQRLIDFCKRLREDAPAAT